MKRYLLYVWMIFLLSGCSIRTGGEAFFTQIDEIEQALEQPEWNTITQHAEELKKIYQDEKWKIQLIGDEGEYEDLNESINRVIAVAKEKDSSNIRLELATTKSILEEIYSL